MAIPDGPASPALTELSRTIREYSLFQAVSQVIERIRDAHPSLDDEALYEHLEFQANPGLGFPGNDIDRVTFLSSAGNYGHACASTYWGWWGQTRHCRHSMPNTH